MVAIFAFLYIVDYGKVLLVSVNYARQRDLRTKLVECELYTSRTKTYTFGGIANG